MWQEKKFRHQTFCIKELPIPDFFLFQLIILSMHCSMSAATYNSIKYS